MAGPWYEFGPVRSVVRIFDPRFNWFGPWSGFWSQILFGPVRGPDFGPVRGPNIGPELF